MADKNYDEQFNRWISLRNKLRMEKREKDYRAVINTCNEIIELSKATRSIGIMKASFEHEIAEAYNKLGDIQTALKYYKTAVKSFSSYRSKNRLNKPDDFLSDIEKIQKKIAKIEAK